MKEWNKETVLGRAREKADSIFIEYKDNIVNRSLETVRLIGHIEGIFAALDWEDKELFEFEDYIANKINEAAK